MNEEELLNSLSDNIKFLVAENQWQEALDSADSSEKDVVAELYLRHICDEGGQLEKVGWNKIEPIKRILIKWIKELGFRESTNPYLQFIQNFYSIVDNQNTTLTETNCILLNNLYADRVLDFADIAGTGENGLSHVIFNHNLYSQKDTDAEFIVKAYEALSSKSFVDRLNYDAVKTKLSQSSIDYINDNDFKTKRDAIIYKESRKPQSSELNSRYFIEELLSLGENVHSEENERINRVAKDFNALSKDERKDMLKSMFNNLTQQEIDSLVSRLK